MVPLLWLLSFPIFILAIGTSGSGGIINWLLGVVLWGSGNAVAKSYNSLQALKRQNRDAEGKDIFRLWLSEVGIHFLLGACLFVTLSVLYLVLTFLGLGGGVIEFGICNGGAC